MNKLKTNYIVDFLSLVAFLVTAVSGLVLLFFLPSGTKQGGIQSFFGVSRHSWVGMHDFFGVILIVLVAIHFFLHWNWMACMTKNFFKKETCDVSQEKEA